MNKHWRIWPPPRIPAALGLDLIVGEVTGGARGKVVYRPFAGGSWAICTRDILRGNGVGQVGVIVYAATSGGFLIQIAGECAVGWPELIGGSHGAGKCFTASPAGDLVVAAPGDPVVVEIIDHQRCAIVPADRTWNPIRWTNYFDSTGDGVISYTPSNTPFIYYNYATTADGDADPVPIPTLNFEGWALSWKAVDGDDAYLGGGWSALGPNDSDSAGIVSWLNHSRLAVHAGIAGLLDSDWLYQLTDWKDILFWTIDADGTNLAVTAGGAWTIEDLTITGTLTATVTVAWGDVTGKPSTFPPSAHTHAPGDIVSLSLNNLLIGNGSNIGAGLSAPTGAMRSLNWNGTAVEWTDKWGYSAASAALEAGAPIVLRGGLDLVFSGGTAGGALATAVDGSGVGAMYSATRAAVWALNGGFWALCDGAVAGAFDRSVEYKPEADPEKRYLRIGVSEDCGLIVKVPGISRTAIIIPDYDDTAGTGVSSGYSVANFQRYHVGGSSGNDGIWFSDYSATPTGPRLYYDTYDVYLTAASLRVAQKIRSDTGFNFNGDDGYTGNVTISGTTLQFKGGILTGVS